MEQGDQVKGEKLFSVFTDAVKKYYIERKGDIGNGGGFLIPGKSFEPIGRWQIFKYRHLPLRLWKYFPIKGEETDNVETLRQGKKISVVTTITFL